MSQARKIRRGLYVGLWLLLANTLVHAQDITTNLVAHWPFDSATTTTADVVGGNTATLVGTPTIVAGKISNALDFDIATGDYLTVADNASIDLGTGDFTFAFWFWPDNAATDMYLLTKGAPFTADGVGFRLFYNSDTAGDPFRLQLNNGSGAASNCDASSADLTGAWHHVAIVVDRNVNMTVYVDGTSTGTCTAVTTHQGSLDTTTQMVIAAAVVTTPVALVEGMIDDLRIYKRALVEADVDALVALGTPAATRRIFSVQ